MSEIWCIGRDPEKGPWSWAGYQLSHDSQNADAIQCETDDPEAYGVIKCYEDASFEYAYQDFGWKAQAQSNNSPPTA